MVSLSYGWGNRLGNTMLMYTAAYIFAKKHSFHFNVSPLMPHFPLSPEKPQLVTTGFNEAGSPLQTKPISFSRKFTEPVIPVHDNNFIHLLKLEQVPDAQYHFQDYFQLKEFVLQYKQQIKDIFDIKFTAQPKKEIFVVFRLGDVAKRRMRLPLEYYKESIERLYSKGCEGGYIVSDSPNHTDVLYLLEKYKLKLFQSEIPAEIINFGKNFNNLVLSEGTFCWWIGVLSNAENIYYNDRRKIFTWHGDIFVYPEWKSLCYDSPGLPVDPV